MDIKKTLFCPNCQNSRIIKKGLSSYGNQRYLCRNCGKSFTGQKVGRPTIKDKPLTPSEQQKRSRGTRIHFQKPEERKGYSACGTEGEKWKARVTPKIEDVTCKLCKNTVSYRKHKEAANQQN